MWLQKPDFQCEVDESNIEIDEYRSLLIPKLKLTQKIPYYQ